MSLQDLGNLGEFIGALGVIASLIYLALQIQQNTRSVRASTFHVATSRRVDFGRAIAEQKELAHILRVGLAGIDQLEDDDDRVRFVMLLSTLFRGFEDFYFQYRAGNLSSESWDAWRNTLRGFIGNPGFASFWALRRLAYTAPFREFVEAERETTEPLPSFAEGLEILRRAT